MGPLSLQPSELAKLVVIFYLAWFIEIRRAPRGVGINDPLRTRSPRALGYAPAGRGLGGGGAGYGHGLHDFSDRFRDAVCLRAFASLRGWRLRRRLPVIYLLIVRVPYRLQRVQTFFSPGSDPQGHGFQLLQSLIAVGSGGLPASA